MLRCALFEEQRTCIGRVALIVVLDAEGFGVPKHNESSLCSSVKYIFDLIFKVVTRRNYVTERSNIPSWSAWRWTEQGDTRGSFALNCLGFASTSLSVNIYFKSYMN